MVEIPPFLVRQVKDGKAVLILGSGASREAVDQHGNHPPMAQELARLLSKNFLGGKYDNYPLDQVAELAISESDLTTVQEYIRQIFEPFEPTKAHYLLCTFPWQGLATTNYDRLIEKAYEKSTSPVQKPQPFIEDGDRVYDRMRDPNSVKLLKLHGCITRTNSPRCPLILTIDQYIQYRDGRKRIFGHLYDWGRERPIVFIGHSLRDPDLRQILQELIADAGDRRPRYYAVLPRIDPMEQRLWDSKRVSLIDADFLHFMNQLDKAIESPFRGIKVDYTQISHAVCERFVRRDSSMSERCKRFLDVEVDYVKECTQNQRVDPKQFYRGMDLGWAEIEQNLDCRRRLYDEILSDVFLAGESDIAVEPNVILIKAHAGAGKSVLLRRIAWDAAHDYNCLCLYLRRHGVIDWVCLQELINLCQERVFLFVYNAADRIAEVEQLINHIGPEGHQLTIVMAERTNEWNMLSEYARSLVSSTYDLRYLSEREIDNLLSLLEKHKALGTLEHFTLEERRGAFKERAGRQLLVALHEATLGKPFEEIVVDEYQNIRPVEAQAMYLSICVLNRLNVDVRAGIIARIHDIRFEDFNAKFFAPLEDVVHSRFDRIIRDYVYVARHPHIADMVFVNVLKDQEEKFDAYIRCLRTLNIDYNSDKIAFQLMIRGRNLLDLFSNPDLVKAIFQEAERMTKNDAYVLQQMAIYQERRKGGDIAKAADLINKAQKLAPHSRSIKHSLAEVNLRFADQAHTELQWENSLSKAEEIAVSLTGRRARESYGYHTLCKIGLRRLGKALSANDEDFSSSRIEFLIRQIETRLSQGLQLFPEDPYLLDAESRLAQLLDDSERALSALEKAFNVNPRNSWFAIRLSRSYQKSSKIDKAKETLVRALDANSNDHRLHYAYSKLLLSCGGADSGEILYHLRRSFSPGDRNYDAQIFYARELFINGEIEEAQNVFSELGKVRMSPETKNSIRYPLEEKFNGTVIKHEVTYCFIERDGLADRIFAHSSNIDETVWNDIIVGKRVKFRIGFTMKSPNAFEVALL